MTRQIGLEINPMPFTAQLLEGEPIILVELSGHLDAQLLREMYQEIASISQSIPGHLYRITNVQQLESSFHEMLEVAREASSGTPGSLADPHITMAFVANDQWIKFTVDTLKQDRFGNLQVPIFRTMNDALAAIRLQIAQEHKSD